jgi:hypothetical protein
MNMTKTRLLLLPSLPLAVAVTLGVLAMLPTSPGVTKANLDRIEIGMPRADVEQILGGRGRPFLGDDEAWMLWEADDGSWVTIVFRDDCVADKHWQSWHDSDNTLMDKIRRVLHLR